jgi:uncharacterized protein
MTAPSVSITGSTSIEITGESLVLLPQRAVLWEREKTLFIADPHFGKAQTFRSAGIAAPERSHDADLAILSGLISACGVDRLIVLGDLLHCRSGVREPVVRSLCAWRERHQSIEAVLVRGNHDRSAGDPPCELGFRCVDAGEHLGPFELRHEPVENPQSGYALAGHIHPGVRLGGSGGFGRKTAARFPAFVFGTRQAILPAFGGMTGLAMVRPQSGDRVAIIADGEVIDLGAA